MTGRLQRLAGKPWTGEERPVGADRVRVPFVDFARTHVHAVGGGEAALLRFLAKERHLVVDKLQRVADAGDARAGGGHAGAVERLALRADDVRGIIPFEAAAVFSRMTGLKVTFASCGAKSCAARKSRSAG